jgi:hypothetical protein
MTGWLSLTDEQKRISISEAEIESGIQAKAIEKDWWVTLVLKALFQTQYAKHMAFKGGTSLSKGWDLISRFSEDIDIALDPQAFGIFHIENPDKKFIGTLKRAGCAFTSTALKIELEKELKNFGLIPGTVVISFAEIPANVPDTDPQTLYVKYKSIYPPNEYLKDEVKIEVSVRSLLTPSEPRTMRSILYTFNPKPIYAEVDFRIETVNPRKTFLEKIFLLHEEFQRKDISKIKVERKSRHYYDLYSMSKAGIFEHAIADEKLYEHIINHREKYNNISWVEYSQLAHKSVSFLPPIDFIQKFEEDYKKMKEEMIYGDNIPNFDQLLFHLKLIQGKIKLKGEPYKLEEVIQKALTNIQSPGFFENKDKNEWEIMKTHVVYFIDENGTPLPNNLRAKYFVEFKVQNGIPYFECIEFG